MSFRAMLRTVVAASVVASAALLAPTSASGAVGDYGYVGGSYPTGTATPTADKPENKLWYAGGSWYGVLWNGTAFTIQRLNSSTNVWSDTGTVVDSRRNSSADTLFRTEGATGVLYVLSHGVAATSTSTSTTLGSTTFSRYTLSGSTWTQSAGYPVAVSPSSSESASFDIDANGYAFVTFTKSKQPYVAVSTVPVGAPGFAFGAPFVPSPTGVPVAGLTGTSDDISAVSSYQGGKILLLWSNQVDSNVYYAVHVPGAPATTWTGGIAAGGPLWADDHINLASIQNDAEGRVFAVMKTSVGDGAGALPTDPQIVLLTFKPVAGTWSTSVFGTVADFHTRPIVVADDATNTLYVFATGPTSGAKVYKGTIYYKSTSLANPSFAPGVGTPFIRDVAADAMNNATSTRQSVNGTTGLVVLAANESTLRYWHNVLPLSSTPKPTATFTVDKTSGVAPLTVKFTDSSSGAPTSWSWNFGDSTPANTTQNPTHVFSTPGTYNVTLTATNAAGSSTSAATTITVTAAPVAPVANFAVSANPTAGQPVTFTDTSTNTPTGWTWNFGDGTGTVATQNAVHTFAAAGTYNVTLTASNTGGTNAVTKAVQVVAAPPPPASGVLYRVNAGGSVAVAGTPGWTTDTTAAPSSYSNVTAARSVISENLTKVIDTTDPSVPAGTSQALFQAHRKDVAGGDTMRWAFPAAKSGTYTVKLYFAETWSQYYLVGGRVFTVQAEGTNVLTNFDTYASVGKLKGVVKTVTVNVTDGTLNLNFVRVKADPFVAAIEVSGPA